MLYLLFHVFILVFFTLLESLSFHCFRIRFFTEPVFPFLGVGVPTYYGPKTGFLFPEMQFFLLHCVDTGPGVSLQNTGRCVESRMSLVPSAIHCHPRSPSEMILRSPSVCICRCSPVTRCFAAVFTVSAHRCYETRLVCACPPVVIPSEIFFPGINS